METNIATVNPHLCFRKYGNNQKNANDGNTSQKMSFESADTT